MNLKLCPIFVDHYIQHSIKDNKNNIHTVYTSCGLLYIYLKELVFRSPKEVNDISLKIPNFIDFIEKFNSDDHDFNFYKEYGRDKLHFEILRRLFQSKEFQSFMAHESKLNEIKNLTTTWESSLDQKKKEVSALEVRLEQSKQTYDFVLLNAGFKSLYDQKKKSFTTQKCVNFIWIFLVIVLPVVNLYIGKYLTQLQQYNWLNGLALVLPVITLMLLCLYFYKIGLQEKRSIQSQMMQLELRMALCQFIHNYADDSEKLHKKNEKGFEKFENIIFSPLVSSDDKIPTTFDGMEQLAKLVSEFRK